MKREKEFKEISIRLNQVRQENKDKIITAQELKELLRGILPTDCGSKVELVRTEIIIRVKKGHYKFPKDPIPWYRIRTFYENCREKTQNYRNSEKSLIGRKDIAKMIEIIKAEGYIVFKKV